MDYYYYTQVISLILLIPLTSSTGSSWSDWSECSRTCDVGVIYRTRNSCTQGQPCEVEDIEYNTCNLQKCPAETPDFRADQCSQYNSQPYNGELLDWTPAIDDQQPCALICTAKEKAVTVTLASRVLDGTLCGVQHSICIHGACKTIGCDDILDSDKAFDSCGVCGGDGSSCTAATPQINYEATAEAQNLHPNEEEDKNSKYFNDKFTNVLAEKSRNGLANTPQRDIASTRAKATFVKKHNNVVVIEVPFYEWEESTYSACSVTCGLGKQQTKVTCKNPKTHEVVIDRFCAQPKPPHHAKTCMRRSCKAKWVAGPWGSCSSSCGGGTSTRNVFCVISGLTGKVEKVDDLQCVSSRPPTKQTCNQTPCPQWQPGQWSKCSVSCGAGYQYRDVVCKRGSEAELCSDGGKPVDKQRCHTGVICTGDKVIDHQDIGERPFKKIPGDDSDDITEDNRGGVDGKDYNQLAFERPPVYDVYHNVNTGDDGTRGGGGFEEKEEDKDSEYYDRGGYSWEEENNNEIADTKTEDGVGDVDYRGNEIMEQERGSGDEEETTVIADTPRFVTSAWGSCDVTCGHGQRYRNVECKTLIAYSNTVQVLPDTRCQEPKPTTTEKCIEENCPIVIVDTVSRNTYAWQFSGHGPCTATCGGGFREPLFKCVRSDPRTVILVATELCSRLYLPTVLKESCNEFQCPARWQIYPYGPCSHACGGGFSVRQVTCVRDQGNGNMNTVPEQLCLEPVPPRSRLCNQVKCPPQWSTGRFSQCSATCGQGMKTRDVQCKQIVHPKRDEIKLDDAFCLQGSRPDSLQPCEMEPCVFLPQIRSDNSYYVQLQQRKQLRFVAGGTVVIIPGTMLRIRCPVINFNKSDIGWTKNGNVITRRGRTKRSKRGVLHIRGVKATDAGVYACYAGNVSSTTYVRIHSVQEALEKFRFRETVNARDPDFLHIFRSVIKATGSKRKEEYTEPFLVRQFKEEMNSLPFKFITTQWGRCSKSCGGAGLQSRQITCEINLDQYYLVVSDDYCYSKGFDKPLRTQDCGYQVCPEWDVGEWANRCTDDYCLDVKQGARLRPLYCVSYDGSPLEHSMCDRKKRPRDKESCLMETCVPKWTTSDWTTCSITCGGEGIHTRSLQCVWEPNNKPASGMCENLLKPDVMKPCQTPACDDTCKYSLETSINQTFWEIEPCQTPACDDTYCRDESNYCSLVQMLNLCRYAEYRTKCCASCTAIGRGPIRLRRYHFT